METSLYFKTILLVAVALGLVFAPALGFVLGCRSAHRRRERFLGLLFEAHTNPSGELDLHPTPKSMKLLDKWWNVLFFLKVAFMIGMVVVTPTSLVGGLVALFGSALTFGPLLGVLMLLMDEVDGMRAMGLTVLTSLGAAAFGMFTGVDLSFLRSGLMVGLLVLIGFSLLGLIFSFSGMARRIKAILGAGLFVLFIMFDFQRLSKLEEAGANDWHTALELAIHIYLDVINLLLEILAAMGE